jgi:hypothetical protein
LNSASSHVLPSVKLASNERRVHGLAGFVMRLRASMRLQSRSALISIVGWIALIDPLCTVHRSSDSRPTGDAKEVSWYSTLPHPQLRTGSILNNLLFHSPKLCRGAPCSHQRTWVKNDGAKPLQRSVFCFPSQQLATTDKVMKRQPIKA